MKQMIKRKDGSYSQRGLWDNIRANRGSGKKPTAQMLKQERKIKTKMAEGGSISDTYMSPGVGADPRFEQYYTRQLEMLNSSGVKSRPSRNDVYSYYKSSSPQSAVDQTGRMIFSNPKGTISTAGTFSQAVDDKTGQVLDRSKQTDWSNLQKDAFDKQWQRFGSGGLNNPGFQALPGYVKAKIRSNMQEGGMTGSPIVDMINNQAPMPMMQMGGSMPQTSAGQSVLREAMAMSKMQSGGKMPIDIARARFMAASNGNMGQAKETASKYGYKMQAGAYIPGDYIPPTMRIGDRGNYSGSDNTRAPNPAVMQQRIAEGQAYKKKISTEQGKIQAQQAHQRAQSNMAANRVKQEQKAAAAKAQQVADMKARIEDSIVVQDMSLSDQFKPENIERATQATGDKLRLFGPMSPLVTSGLFEADPNSFIDNYLNPAKLVGDMATNLGQGINETAKTGDFTALGKALATPVIAGATMGYLKAPLHSLEKKAVNYLTKNVNNTAISAAMANPAMTTGIGAGASLIGQGISRTAKTASRAAEHDLVHRTTTPTALAGSIGKQLIHKHGGTIKDMYYMKNGGQFPDRYKKMGFSGVDKPKKTTSGGKSHAVVTKVDGNYKLIRFGQAGVSGSPDGSPRNERFKARHAKNIAKGKSSAAYWANKVKW